VSIDIRSEVQAALNGDRPTEIVEPLFDVEGSRFGRFMAAEPPAREYVLHELLPANVVGLLAAMGGAGKSYLAFQLAMSVVVPVPFLGIRIGAPGSVLCLFAEDDEDELHRRGRTLLDHYGLGTGAREMVAERLHVVSRVGADNMLTRTGGDGDVVRTQIVGRLIEAAQTIPDLRLIVVDPVSRFRGGNANQEEHATRFVEALEVVRAETGATVLGLHHVNQAGIREGGGQEIVRGSTALVDGVRWVATLQRLRRDQAKDYGLQEAEADRYLRFEVPKSNYAPPFGGLWLRREAGGVLVPVELTETAREPKAASEYMPIVRRLQELLAEKGPLSRYQIRAHSGAAGALAAGDQTVRTVLERAVREGYLVDSNGQLSNPREDAE
jgi:RecA-family ATPase